MAQREIEVILTRQLASYLAMPILVIDPKGDLLFFNEPAESILGRRFDETGEIRRTQWLEMFNPTDDGGVPQPLEDNPLFIAAQQRRPAHGRFRIDGLDGVARDIEGTAFPLIGQSARYLGAVGIFWEITGAPRRP